jgi:Phage integrase, N-terminal SAM-like domain
MPTPIPSSVALVSVRDADPFAQAQMAAAAYLACYSGRTLETYRYDLRTYFQWCTDVGLEILEAKRAHIELWRSAMEERGLAASTIDRRLSTICGFYRFAHIDGRIPSNPAQYARRPKVYPSEGCGLGRGELGSVALQAERYDPDHAAPGCPLGTQRSAGERGLCHQCRGPRLQPGPPDTTHHRKGQQAGRDPAGPESGSDHRPRPRRALRRSDPSPP